MIFTSFSKIVFTVPAPVPAPVLALGLERAAAHAAAAAAPRAPVARVAAAVQASAAAAATGTPPASGWPGPGQLVDLERRLVPGSLAFALLEQAASAL